MRQYGLCRWPGRHIPGRPRGVMLLRPWPERFFLPVQGGVATHPEECIGRQHHLLEIFGHDAVPVVRKENIRVALATLAMGDLLACEFSQSAHLSLCLRQGVMAVGELLTLRTPLPRDKVIAGVIIDDLVVMECIIREEFASRGHSVEDACGRIKSAIDGYAKYNLEANIKKSFFNESCCRFLGWRNWRTSWVG